MADAERCLVCGIIIPEGRQVCPVCGVPEREDDMLKKKDPILSTIEGRIKVEMALEHIQTIEKMMETEGAE